MLIRNLLDAVAKEADATGLPIRLVQKCDDEILEALEESRWRVQAAIGRQTTFKRTPVLSFKVDMAIRTGERIESILRENPLPED